MHYVPAMLSNGIKNFVIFASSMEFRLLVAEHYGYALCTRDKIPRKLKIAVVCAFITHKLSR